MSDNNPPNYNDDEVLEEISFAESGQFSFYRFGNVTPGNLEKLMAPVEDEELVFYQRVFDSELGWCYYQTVGSPDPNPPSNLTVPAHLGSISSSQILNVIGLPTR